MDKILDTVKKVLGIPLEDDYFNPDLIMHTNMALTTAFQLGIGRIPYTITDVDDEWCNILPDSGLLNLLKIYIPLKVRTTFDPPTGSAVAEALKNSLAELEFRIIAQIGDGEVIE